MSFLLIMIVIFLIVVVVDAIEKSRQSSAR